jgi:hypothetical protein
MLGVTKENSKVIVKSSSINPLKVCIIPTFSFNLELIVMALFKASLSNQWSLDWFIVQAVTIRDKQSIIV